MLKALQQNEEQDIIKTIHLALVSYINIIAQLTNDTVVNCKFMTQFLGAIKVKWSNHMTLRCLQFKGQNQVLIYPYCD